MKKLILILWLCSVVCTSCDERENRKIEEIVDTYYQIYNERKDFDLFLSFYDDSIVLEDIISGERIEGKDALRAFFDWGNPNFNKLEANGLKITNRIIGNGQAVVKGYFLRFKWGDQEFEAMHFTTILTFNEAGSITKQVDWFNYPDTLIDYSGRKNANDWIK